MARVRFQDMIWQEEKGKKEKGGGDQEFGVTVIHLGPLSCLLGQRLTYERIPELSPKENEERSGELVLGHFNTYIPFWSTQ